MNSSWAIVVVVALVIMAVFGYWAINNDGGNGGQQSARIENNVSKPADSGSDRTRIDVRPNQGSATVDVQRSN